MEANEIIIFDEAEYLDEDEYLEHYGMPRRSGRYPYGSGDNPYQHGADFLGRIEELKKQGFNEKAIADSFGLTTTQLRTQKALAKDERRTLEVERAKSLRADGKSLNEIADIMGYKNDSSIRSLLNESSEARMNQAKVTAEYLKKMVDEKGMIDVGAGVERELGISKEKLKQALYILEMEGYPKYGGGIPQPTNPGKQTNVQVLCPPGTPHKDIYQFDKIHSVVDYDKILTEDGSKIRPAFEYPASMDISRLKIRYAEDGGSEKDGVIEIRRGVDDLSLGDATYAQVRILVDKDRYLKGMAIYSDDMPKGVDVVFNTNKKSDVAPRDVLKKIKDDPDNPFGALIKEKGGQTYYTDKDGNEKLGLINKTRVEGDWRDWQDKLSSQFLSKQSQALIKKQLNLDITDKQAEFDEIMSLTNPTVKRHFLKSFAEDCDAAAVDLKAAALPRQKYQVLMPIPTMKDTEVYAPNYENGEKVALVRYPHGGTFEIPVLTVNNKHVEARKVLGTSPLDVVGINSKVAERLSGADFDGDAVMVIPCKQSKIVSTDKLKGLDGFDPKMEYGTVEKDGAYYNKYGQKIKVMTRTNYEMGVISNLITDMTLRGAKEDELARAVRHSMVVIDAEKHKLDYKRSEIENNISALKKDYQEGGASTLISRSKSPTPVDKRVGTPRINQKGKDWYDPSKPEGALIYKSVQEEYIDKNGKVQIRRQQVSKMSNTDDAFTLVSEARTPAERAYAEYANKMKAMANQARKEMVYTERLTYSATASKTYQNEVNSLLAKLNVSLKNAPRERQAQALANSVVKAKKQSNPYMTASEIKKENQRALNAARIKFGASREKINVTDREWEAIQAGAISDNRLTQILRYADADDLRQRAMPRSSTTLSQAKVNRINQMKASGYTTAEIAQQMGISTSTVHKYAS